VDVTVKDKATGQPVTGNLTYFVLPHKPTKNPFERPFADAYGDFMAVRTDGTLRFAGVARRAIVAFRTDWTKYPVPREAATIQLPGTLAPSNYQAFAEINPRADDKSVKVEFILGAGGTAKGKVMGPDGEPLKGALVAGLRDGWSGDTFGPLETAEFTVLGLESGRSRLLCFAHEDKKLAGSTVIRGDEKGPITVKLAPWATVAGRLLDKDGAPIKNAELSLTEVPRPKPGEPLSLDTGVFVDERSAYKPSRNPRTDDQGRFRVEGLVPGLKYNLALYDSNGAVLPEQVKWLGLVFTDLVLQSGETKELGDVRLRPFPKE
jgi:hypothetical protein